MADYPEFTFRSMGSVAGETPTAYLKAKRAAKNKWRVDKRKAKTGGEVVEGGAARDSSGKLIRKPGETVNEYRERQRVAGTRGKSGQARALADRAGALKKD